MTTFLLILAFGLAVLAPLGVLLHRRQRDVEEGAARTLTRLRHRHAALTDRTAEVGHEVAALYGVPRSPSDSYDDR
jgi:hypothetical protein